MFSYLTNEISKQKLMPIYKKKLSIPYQQNECIPSTTISKQYQLVQFKVYPYFAWFIKLIYSDNENAQLFINIFVLNWNRSQNKYYKNCFELNRFIYSLHFILIVLDCSIHSLMYFNRINRVSFPKFSFCNLWLLWKENFAKYFFG